MTICLAIPIYTKSEANCSESHWVKRRRAKEQKQWVRVSFVKAQFEDFEGILPCHIKLTRYAPRSLDSDNLPVSMKYVRDEIADILLPGLAPGRADGSDLFTWEYAQVKSKMYFVKVEITPKGRNDITK
jgi:hypothetical protein